MGESRNNSKLIKNDFEKNLTQITQVADVY